MLTVVFVLLSKAVHIADCRSPNTDHPPKSKSQRDVLERVRVVASMDEAYYGCDQTLVTWDETLLEEGRRLGSKDPETLVVRRNVDRDVPPLSLIEAQHA